MSQSNVNNFLIPNVTKLPSQKNVKKVKDTSEQIQNSEFNSLLKDKIQDNSGISLSTHAARRLQERNLEMDGAEILKLEIKGGQDSLVITEKAAYIVDVANKKVVTAIDKGSLLDNVFTKIDSTVMV
jgi:flagellar operon protein